jgi:phage shock protein C
MKAGKTLYRDPNKAKLAGVCAGIADYFGMETWLVRILVVSGFFLLAGPFMFFGYIAAWFILEKKPKNIHTQTHSQAFGHQNRQQTHVGKGWHNVPEEDDEKVVVKSKVWQAGEPAKQAFSDIKQQFEKNESRLRNLETYVTSSEFQLNQENSRL